MLNEIIMLYLSSIKNQFLSTALNYKNTHIFQKIQTITYAHNSNTILQITNKSNGQFPNVLISTCFHTINFCSITAKTVTFHFILSMCRMQSILEHLSIIT